MGEKRVRKHVSINKANAGEGLNKFWYYWKKNKIHIVFHIGFCAQVIICMGFHVIAGLITKYIGVLAFLSLTEQQKINSCNLLRSYWIIVLIN